jgi:hypothetical protein
MGKLTYLFDIKKGVLHVFRGHKLLGGYLGKNADDKFLDILCSGADVRIGELRSVTNKQSN